MPQDGEMIQVQVSVTLFLAVSEFILQQDDDIQFEAKYQNNSNVQLYRASRIQKLLKH